MREEIIKKVIKTQEKITMSQRKLNRIIKNHQHWLNRDCDGWEEMCANLKDADLEGLNLRCVNLYKADLGNANLSKADLSGSNLKGANLRGANLKDAKLRDTFLSGANLSEVDLNNAYLRFACLEGANLKDANLMFADLFAVYLNDADLSGANLKYANLCGAVLIGANLTGSCMCEANLSGAVLSESVLDKGERCRLGMILTEPMKGYKKTAEGNVIELEIPEGAIVFSINNSECRANKATVTKCEGIQHSWFDPGFEYKEGNIINIEGFNLQYNIECAEGVHFFRTKEEAEKYTITVFGI